MHSKKQLIPLLIIVLIAAAMIASSCGNRWQVNGKRAIAFVNKQPISYAEYDSVVKAKGLRGATPQEDADKKRAVLDEMIDTILIHQETDSVYQALSRDPGMQDKANQFLEQPVLKLLYDKEIVAKVTVPDSELQKYYNDNIDKYTTPEQVRAKHILIKLDIDSTQAKNPKKLAAADRKAQKTADELYKRIMKGEDFSELAKEYSDDPQSAQRGGDLGYFTKGRMVKEFDDAAFSMKEDEISKPIKTEFGYHIIKVIEHRPEEIKPFDDTMKEQLRGTLESSKGRDRAQAFVDSLREAANYKYNEKILSDDEDSTIQRDEWVAIVDGVDTLKYARYIDQKPKYMRYKNLTAMNITDQEDMIKTLAVNNLLVRYAKAKGLYEDSTIVDQRDQFIRTQAKSRIEEMSSAKDYQPTDSMLQSYFDEHKDEFVVDKPLHVYHIIFEDSAQAVAVYDSIINGADFVEMAKRYYPGEPEIRDVAYDLDFISEQEMPEEFWKAANALQVGSVSPPVKTKWGWHVIKLVSRKQSKTFEQVKGRISNALREEANNTAKQAYLDKLWASSEISINDQLLNQYKITHYSGLPTLQMRE